MALGNPYQMTRKRPYPAPGAPLQAQKPMTEGQQIADAQNLQGLKTGQFADVQSAQGATTRSNLLRTNQALQAARGSAARSGISAQESQRGQDMAMASANAQNLNATNSVNQLQRQYRGDALNQAAATEDRTYGVAKDERAFQTGRADTEYNRGIDATKYADSRGDLAYNRATDESRYGDSRIDRKEDKAEDRSRYADTRGDVSYARETEASRYGDSRQDLEYDRSENRSRYADSRGDINYARETDAARYGDTRGDVNYARQTEASRYGDSRTDRAQDIAREDSRYSDTRGDVAYARNTEASRYGDSRADRAQDITREDSRYADTRGDTEYNRSESRRMEGKGDQLAAINAIQDPRAKARAMNAYNRGEDPRSLISGMYDDSGTLNSDYASENPGQLSARAKVDELRSYYPGKSQTELEQMALAEREQDRASEREPVIKATQERGLKEIEGKINSGATLDETDFTTAREAGAIKNYSSQTLPIDAGAKALIGKPVSIEGKQFKVVAAGRVTKQGGSHSSYTVVESPDGTIMYNYGGRLTNIPPKTERGADRGKSAVYSNNSMSYQ